MVICWWLRSKPTGGSITPEFVTTAQKLAMQYMSRNPIRFVLIFRF